MKNSRFKDIIRLALKEDIGKRDITSQSLISKKMLLSAKIIAKEPGIIAGIDIARNAFALLNSRIRFTSLVKDGYRVKKGMVVARIYGPATDILTAERTALNFLSRLSGIATKTAEFVKRVRQTDTKIMDTRKTTPALRSIERYAVKVGGGHNHRMGLFDQVLIKDNHLSAYRLQQPEVCAKDLIRHVVSKAKKKASGKKVEIEVKNIREAKEALRSGADIVMLDNMSLADIRTSVRLRGKKRRPLLEASGGVDLRNVRAIAKTGVDRISIGALTHSAPALDFSLEVIV